MPRLKHCRWTATLLFGLLTAGGCSQTEETSSSAGAQKQDPPGFDPAAAAALEAGTSQEEVAARFGQPQLKWGDAEVEMWTYVYSEAVKRSTTSAGDNVRTGRVVFEKGKVWKPEEDADETVPRRSAAERKIQRDFDSLLQVAELFRIKTGSWPENLEEMVDSENRQDGRRVDSLRRISRDPWGNPYGYDVQDGGPVFWTLGSEGAEGGVHEEADHAYAPLRLGW